MPDMPPCSVSRCGAPTLRRCDCCGRPFCSAACSQAAWAVHRSGGAGEPARVEGEGGAELPAPEPVLGEGAPVRLKAMSEEAAPTPPAEAAPPHAGAGKAPANEVEETDPARICAYPPCDLPRIGFCTRCLLVGWCSVAHQKAHWKAGHKAVCAPAETKVVPYVSWEQRVMAEAKAAAPASFAATAKLSWIPDSTWDFDRDDAPPKATLKAWRKAADGGHAVAQCCLGLCYYFGKGCARDLNFAAKLYAKSAAQRCEIGQYNLGVVYDRGEGVAQDFKIAFECFAKAAAQGDAASQMHLGSYYEHGIGVAKDLTLAFEWLSKAAAQGDHHAQRNLGIHHQFGTAGAPKNDKLAAEWYAKSAAQGSPLAQLSLGICYECGVGVAQDSKRAAELFRKAAAQGVAEAAMFLALCNKRI